MGKKGDKTMSVKENLDEIQDRVIRSAEKFGHSWEDIHLVAVTKFVDEDRIRQALDWGVKEVGENQVQEIERKMEIFQGAQVHMIGQLQSNKVRKLTDGVALIQSIDRKSLLKEINRIGQRENMIFKGLIQVNNAKEEGKGGVYKEDLPELLDYVETLDHVQIEGLMNIAPFLDDPEEVRPYFRDMRNLFEKISQISYNQIKMNILSMGMTHDYEVALEEGANMVRIGRAIFGERDYSK